MTDNEKIIEEARAEVMPFESWLKLPKESGEAYSAFCVFRDLGLERNIRKAYEKAKDVIVTNEKQYGGWRNWAVKFHWKERTDDFDRHNEQIKQSENRKTIEAQAEKHRQVTGKILDVVQKKLDTMNPEDLTQGNVIEWANMAIKSEREIAGLLAPNEKAEPKQGELSFVKDFEGL